MSNLTTACPGGGWTPVLKINGALVSLILCLHVLHVHIRHMFLSTCLSTCIYICNSVAVFHDFTPGIAVQSTPPCPPAGFAKPWPRYIFFSREGFLSRQYVITQICTVITETCTDNANLHSEITQSCNVIKQICTVITQTCTVIKRICTQ